MKGQEEEWARLLRQANGGDAPAYEQFLRSLAPALRAIARGAVARAGGSVDSEDIVQEALIAIHLKRHTWIETEPVGPWLRAIVRHKFIDALRRRGRAVHLPLEDFQEFLEVEDAAPDFARRDVERHLDRLSPRQRDVVRSIALEGNSIRETANGLAMTEGAVRVTLHRAIAALASAMRISS